MFLLVPAYPGCPGSKAVKRSLWSLIIRATFQNTSQFLLFSRYRHLLQTLLNLHTHSADSDCIISISLSCFHMLHVQGLRTDGFTDEWLSSTATADHIGKQCTFLELSF